MSAFLQKGRRKAVLYDPFTGFSLATCRSKEIWNQSFQWNQLVSLVFPHFTSSHIPFLSNHFQSYYVNMNEHCFATTRGTKKTSTLSKKWSADVVNKKYLQILNRPKDHVQLIPCIPLLMTLQIRKKNRRKKGNVCIYNNDFFLGFWYASLLLPLQKLINFPKRFSEKNPWCNILLAIFRITLASKTSWKLATFGIPGIPGKNTWCAGLSSA